MGGIVTKSPRRTQGHLPLACSSLIEDDANPWVLEGVSGEIIYRNFQPDLNRTPVEYKVASVTKGFSVAVTRSRIVTATWGRPQLHLPLADARLWRRHIRILLVPSSSDTAMNARETTGATSTRTPTTGTGTNILSLAADAHLFDPHYRGVIEVRWHTNEASELYRRIQAGLAFHNNQARDRRRMATGAALLIESSFSGGTTCTYDEYDSDDDDNSTNKYNNNNQLTTEESLLSHHASSPVGMTLAPL